MASAVTLKLNRGNFVSPRLKRYDGEPASPIFIYRSPKVGVLLLHGFTASPDEMQDLAEYLADKNLTVFAPLIAGHGSNLDDLASSTIGDWEQSVTNSSLALKEVVEKVYIAGSSLGGNLAFYLATQFPDLFSGVVSFGTAIRVRWQRLFKASLNTYGYFKKYQRKLRLFYPLSSHQRGENYNPFMPIPSVRNLFTFIKEITVPSLKRVALPTLIIQSAKDPVVDSSSARYIYQNLGSGKKQILWLQNGAHALGALGGREEKKDNLVFESIYKFIAEN